MKMGTTNPFKDQTLSLTKKLQLTLYALLPIAVFPIALIYLYFYSLPFPPSKEIQLPHSSHITVTSPTSPSATVASDASSSPSSYTFSPSSSAEKEKTYGNSCDYSNGKWVRDSRGPFYNDTTCGTVKESEKCISNGRPDSGYLYWRWKPSQCHLPRFEPNTFLQLIKNKHVAFVGDSLARNQLESLLCMLATASTPNLVYRNGEDNKFRRWYFPSHNASFSLYWSPFLVQGIERANAGPYYNSMYLDHVDERWAGDVVKMDLIVLSLGHWFLIPSVYYEGDSVIGSLNCPDLNHTQMDFYVPLGKALRTALNSIIDRKGAKGDGIDVIVKTFSPAHFEGDWNKAGTCSKTRPYREEEKQLEGMDSEIRRIEMEEMEDAKAKADKLGGFRFKALDVTKLALLRPDGHPGAYMYPFPFANGVPDRVQNDCVHWCLPGPIDAWNEILLEMLKKWEEQPKNVE